MVKESINFTVQLTGVLRTVLSVGPCSTRSRVCLEGLRKELTAVPRHHCYQHHAGRDGADSNVHGAIMRLISDFEEATFIAIVVVMAALAVVVVAAV